MDAQTRAREGTNLTRRAAVSVVGDRGARQLLSMKRTAVAVGRNVVVPGGRENARRIRAFEDTHVGETCVIVGNGPSLNHTEMDLLEDVPTFGLNRIYLMYDKLGFAMTYHVVVNKYVTEQCSDELLALSAPLFTLARNGADLPAGPGVMHLNNLSGPRFSTNLPLGVWQGATVTFVAMQVAYWMGFGRVVLIGVDHNFVDQGRAHKVVQSDGGDANHFDPNYFGKGFTWQLPDLETSEIAYRAARDTFAASGREIVDSTVGGKLDVFPKLGLREALCR